MSVFSDAELAYLAKSRLGRLATIDAAGMPHVVPLGWRYNPGLDVIDIGGRDFAQSRKFRNAQHNPHVTLVIDGRIAAVAAPLRHDPRPGRGPGGGDRAGRPANRAPHPAASHRSDQLGDGVRRGIVPARRM